MKSRSPLDLIAGFLHGLPSEIVQAIFLIFAALQLLVVLFLAIAVLNDARIRRDGARGLFLVGPWVWSLIVLLTGGYAGALGYWLIHYSALRHSREEKG